MEKFSYACNLNSLNVYHLLWKHVKTLENLFQDFCFSSGPNCVVVVSSEQPKGVK